MLIDWLRDFFGWVLAFLGGLFLVLARMLHNHSARLAVLEKTVTDIAEKLPKSMLELSQRLGEDLSDLKGSVDDMRNEARDGREKLYGHVDDVRKELKADINRESDRRAN